MHKLDTQLNSVYFITKKVRFSKIRFPIFAMNLLRKLKRNIEDYGAITALRKGLMYSLKPFYENRVYRIYRIELENLILRNVGRNDFTFRIIDSKDSMIIEQIEKMEEWLHGELVTRLEKKGLCLAALDKERVAGFNLIAFKEAFIPLLKHKKVLPQDEAWSEQITVHKDYRRRGLASDLRYRIFFELKKKGIRKLYSGALKSNEIGLRVNRKVGFKEIADVKFIRFLGYKNYRCNRLNK